MATEPAGSAPSSFFVSYAREDQAFVRRLHDALKERGREVWVDWEAAPTFVKWRPEVTTAIEAADVFIFVISQESAKSESCLMEVEAAAAAHKRFAPLVLVEVKAKKLPAEVADPTWLYFSDGYDFDAGIGQLVEAADTDFPWLRLHTRLQVRAREWDEAGRDDSLLARGRDLEAALHWLAESALKTERDVSPLQVAFLEAARRLEAAEAERARELYARTLARQLAAQSELVRGSDVESVRTSVLLAAESVERWPNVEGDRALRRGLALLSRRPVQRIAHRAGQVALARDGRLAVTAAGSTVSIWDVASGSRIARRRCDAEVTRLDVSPEWALAFDAEHRAHLWPAGGGRGRGFDCGAPPVAVALAGDFLAVAVADTVHLWPLAGGAPELHLPVDGEVTALAVGAGGGALAATVNVGWNGSLRVWSLPAGEPVDPIALDGIVNAAAFAADGGALAALAVPTGPFMGPLRGYEDVKLFDLWHAWQHGDLAMEILRHDTPVHRVALGPGDEHVATVAEPNTVHVWSVSGGRPRGRMTSSVRVTAFAVAAGGERLATAHDDGTVRVTDVATAGAVLAVEADARAVALDPDGRLVVTGHEETVVWSTETGAEVARVLAGFPTSTLAFGRDGRLLVTGSESGTAVLDPDGTVTALPYDGPVFASAWDGDRVVTVSTVSIGSETRGDYDLRVWDAGRVVSRVDRPEQGVLALDGRLLADAAGAEVVVRDVETGAEQRLATGAGVTGLAFSPDGGRLAVVAGQRVRVWDVGTSVAGPEREIGDAWIGGVDPAGRYVAVNGSGLSSGWLLDLQDGRTIATADTSDVEIDAAGRFAVLIGDLGPVEVRALPSGDTVVVLPHQALGAAFSPDGAHVATAGVDGSLRVWELPGGAEVARMEHPGRLFSPCFSDDGALLAASCADGWVWVWTWRPADLAAEARARAGRGLTPEEHAAYLPDAA